MIRPVVACIALLGLVCSVAVGQEGVGASEALDGVISGQVLGPGGAPVANINVRARAYRPGTSGGTAATDADGRFAIRGLERQTYRLSATDGDLIPQDEDRDAGEARVGETVVVRVMKGAVITGRVLDADGDPVIAVQVRAVRLRDSAGRPARSSEYDDRDQTDDRGVYRIFGLRPGAYVVGTTDPPSWQYGRPSARSGDVPTYYPSSSRDTAATVAVSPGQEVGGIDITYRSIHGHRVEGVVTGASSEHNVDVFLMRPGSAESIAMTSARGGPDRDAFAIDAVPDGDYDARATEYVVATNESAFSDPVRVAVRGGDVTGVRLDLESYEKIAGSVVIEASPPSDGDASCKPSKQAFVGEVSLVAVRTGIAPRPTDDLRSSPNEDGTFEVLYCRPATYHVRAGLPDARLFVRSIGRPIPPPGARTPRDAPPVDYARDGIAVARGKSASDVRMVVAFGAGSVSGRVIPEANQRLPDHGRLYLVPAEDSSRDDGCRYFETWIAGDGSFALSNLAPGRYFAVVRSEPSEADGLPPSPAFWDAVARTKLRSDAVTRAVGIEVQPCQDVASASIAWTGK